METLEIEDLKNLVVAIDFSRWYATSVAEKQSLDKSRGIIEQMIKDREFERDQTTLPKI